MHVCAAAGAGIHALDADDAHIPVDLLFAAVFDVCQRLAVGHERLHRLIAPDGLIRQQLHAADVLLGQRAVKIHGHGLRADVKTHVIIPEKAVHQSGKHVLAAVLLHHVQPARRVHMAAHLAADCQRRADQVLHLAVNVVRVEHLHAAQCAVIRALSAALREKRRLIQRDDIAVFPLHAGFDHGGKVQHIHIFVV